MLGRIEEIGFRTARCSLKPPLGRSAAPEFCGRRRAARGLSESARAAEPLVLGFLRLPVFSQPVKPAGIRHISQKSRARNSATSTEAASGVAPEPTRTHGRVRAGAHSDGFFSGCKFSDSWRVEEAGLKGLFCAIPPHSLFCDVVPPATNRPAAGTSTSPSKVPSSSCPRDLAASWLDLKTIEVAAKGAPGFGACVLGSSFRPKASSPMTAARHGSLPDLNQLLLFHQLFSGAGLATPSKVPSYEKGASPFSGA